MGFRKTQFPRKSGIVDTGPRCGAGSSVTAGDEDDLSAGLGNTGGDGTNTGLTDQLDTDAGAAVGVFQIIDQLCEVFDGIDIMVGRRRDQADTGSGVAGFGDPGIDLGPRKMAALAGLGALSHFDLNLLRTVQVLACHAEAAAGYLLDRAAAVGLAWFDDKTLRRLAALTGIAFGVQMVHGDGQCLVSFLGD